MIYTTADDKGRTKQAATIDGALCHAAAMIYLGDQAKHQARATLAQGKPYTVAYGFKTVTITPTHNDPHQADEAAAFTLTHQAGPAAVDTTGDMFGYDADDLAHWQAARCSTNLRRAATHTADLFDREF